MKELGPIGGVYPARPLDPPVHNNPVMDLTSSTSEDEADESSSLSAGEISDGEVVLCPSDDNSTGYNSDCDDRSISNRGDIPLSSREVNMTRGSDSLVEGNVGLSETVLVLLHQAAILCSEMTKIRRFCSMCRKF